ncbi:MAG: hypothetical protein QXL01_00040 [Thermoplasmatales archaeon]
MGITRSEENLNKSASVRWDVEFFPFGSEYPKSNEFGGIFPSLSGSVLSVGVRTSTQESITLGIKNLNFSKSKFSPEGTCTFTIVGNVESLKHVIPGTWLIISSGIASSVIVDGNKPNESHSTGITSEFTQLQLEQRIPRYIGQIFSFTTNYIADPNTGLIRQVTVFSARAWSHALTVPVRLDILSSFLQFQAGAELAGIESLLKKAGNLIDGSNTTQDLKKIMDLSFSAFSLARLILIVIGAANKIDATVKYDNKTLDNHKEVAVTMPSVPKSLLNRLGLEEADPKNAFNTGFTTIWGGVQNGPIRNDGTWNGILDLVELDYLLKTNFNKDPSDRPQVTGIAAILQSGASAWDLLNSICDPSLNEFFTDLVYEKGAKGDIVARPVIFARDKPFCPKVLLDNELSDVKDELSNFTKYDDLPRIYIDSTYIQELQLSNTITNSKNFIRVAISNMIVSDDINKFLSNANGLVRLDPEMRRFGGNSITLSSNYFASNFAAESNNSLSVDSLQDAISDVASGEIPMPPSKFLLEDWIKKIVHLAKAWYGYDYRMAYGTLTLKDNNFTFTLGMNAQFRVGEYLLVGHIEAIHTTVTVDEKGNHKTITRLELSRIMQYDENETKLRFIPISAMMNLMNAPKQQVPWTVNTKTSSFLDISNLG